MHSAIQHAPGGAWVLSECDDPGECVRETQEWASLCADAGTYCEVRIWDETPPTEIQKAMEEGNFVWQEDRYDLDASRNG